MENSAILPGWFQLEHTGTLTEPAVKIPTGILLQGNRWNSKEPVGFDRPAMTWVADVRSDSIDSSVSQHRHIHTLHY